MVTFAGAVNQSLSFLQKRYMSSDGMEALQAFAQVRHDSLIFTSIHLFDPYVMKARVDLSHQTDSEE